MNQPIEQEKISILHRMIDVVYAIRIADDNEQNGDKNEDEEESSTASNVLIINSLDDLKARLAKVILMILIVRFFEHAISMKFDTPLDLLYLSAGIALLGLALFLSHSADVGTLKH